MFEEVQAKALKRALAEQLEESMQAAKLTKLDEIRLLEQATDVGTCVMTRHRMIRMPKKRFTIFRGNACRVQTAPE